MEEDLFEDFKEIKTSRTRRQVYGYVYEIDFDRPIGRPEEFREELDTFRNAGKNDIVKCYLNTPGGDFDTLVQIINAMRNCQATIVTYLEGSANSAGSFIFLEGDNYIVGDHAEMLSHEASLGAFDSSNKAKTRIDFTLRRVEKLARDCYQGFLTEEEIDSMLEGKDFWFEAEEIRERLEKMIEFRKSQEIPPESD